MITFPDGFIAIKYPGYFWHPESLTLYSLKSGVMKPLCLNKCMGVKEGGRVRLVYTYNFAVSVKGRSFRLSRTLLKLGRYHSKKQEIQVSSNALQRSRAAMELA